MNNIDAQHQQAQQEKINRIVASARRTIFVTFQKEGIHCFPAAATDPSFKTGDWLDVSFLASPHRHIFYFKVWIEVEHNDRDIEFIQFKRWLENLYATDALQLNNQSCEMMADNLYYQIAAKYPDRYVRIEIAEDDENGCSVEYHTVVPLNQISV